MVMYLVQLSQSGWFEQVRTLLMTEVLTPQCNSEIMIKENLSKGDSLRDEETTVDESKESEISVVPMMPKPQSAKCKKRMMKTGKQGVPKTAEVTVLAELRMQPCD